MQSTDDPELLTDGDVQRLYKIKPSTLKTLRARRQIPFVRFGVRIIRYKRAELERWLADSAVAQVTSRTAG